MARGEEMKMKPAREEISPARAKEIMESVPTKTSQTLAEEKAAAAKRRVHD